MRNIDFFSTNFRENFRDRRPIAGSVTSAERKCFRTFVPVRGTLRHSKINTDPILERRSARREPALPAPTMTRAVHHDARTQYRSNRNEYRIDRIEKTQNATFEGIKPNVPGFFRIGIRFERISGRSAQFLQKWHFSFLPLLGELSRTSLDWLNSLKSGKNEKCHF